MGEGNPYPQCGCVRGGSGQHHGNHRGLGSEVGLSPMFPHVYWQGASPLQDTLPVSVKGGGRGIPAQPALWGGGGGAPTRMPGNTDQSKISRSASYGPGPSGSALLVVTLQNLTTVRRGRCCDPILQVSHREVKHLLETLRHRGIAVELLLLKPRGQSLP